MQLIDGLSVSAAIKKELAQKVSEFTQKGHRVPHLVAVLVGEDGASQTYVSNKMKSCQEVGIRSTLLRRPSQTTEAELLGIVNELNADPEVDGFIVQLPLPAHIHEHHITLAIDPAKDVDGFHPTNLGNMVLGIPTYLPATPYGITRLLAHYQIPTAGKHCVVVGRSHIVGSPMSILLARKGYPGDCTVTLAHSRTPDLKAETLRADILVAALGKPGFITADMVKEGAVVIDVGTTRVPDTSKKSGFSLRGDVDFSQVAPKCSWITPVPGGVGPMTVTSLLENTVMAYQKRMGLSS